MARIRSVHPGLWTDEAFVTVSPLARLLAIGIWNECDDQGVFEWKPLQLKMRLLPVDNADVPALLSELLAANIVARYEANGRSFGVVRNFGRYQRPKKPNLIHPMPAEWRKYAAREHRSSELDGDEGGFGPELSPAEDAASSEPVRHQFRTGSAESGKVPADGGGRRKEEEEKEEERTDSDPSDRPLAAASVSDGAPCPAEEAKPPPSARDILWRQGLAILAHLTGKPAGRCRSFLGRLLQLSGDDCVLVMTKLHEAQSMHPLAEAEAWLTRACDTKGRRPAPQRRSRMSWMRDDPQFAAMLGRPPPAKAGSPDLNVIDASEWEEAQ